MPGLQVDGIRKAYGAHLAVSDVSFEVGPGEIVGFVGPNGAGKSTTLRIVTGLLTPDAGRVRLADVDARTHPRAYRAALGALIEAPASYPMLTAMAHLQYVARLRGTLDRGRVRDVLESVGLDPDSRKTVRQFSLGMKQRLGLAMAIYGRPSLLVLDEPMNGLDPMGIADLRAFLRRCPDQFGSSVLVSSHLLGEVEQTCDRVLFLREGRLISETRLRQADGGSELRRVLVRTDDDARALGLLRAASFVVEAECGAGGTLECRVETGAVGQIAPLLVAHGIALLELTPRTQALEAAYLEHYGRDAGRVIS